MFPDIKTENLASLEGVDQTGPGQSLEHSFHKDKRLFLMWTPYLKNETTIKYGNTPHTDFDPEEPTTLQVRYSGVIMPKYSEPLHTNQYLILNLKNIKHDSIKVQCLWQHILFGESVHKIQEKLL